MSSVSITSAPLDFRLQDRWLAATVEEVKDILAARDGTSANLDETIDPAVTALVETTTHFALSWSRLLETLDSTGVSGHVLAPLVRTARSVLDKGSELLSLLRENTSGVQEQLEQSGDTLGRIGRELAAVEKALAPAEPDDESIARGLAEAERGEGEDVGTVLARFQSNGEM
jgi:hypothetical protein